MTKEEYQAALDEIADKALKAVEDYDYSDADNPDERKKDDAGDVALDMTWDHPWMQNIDECFSLLKHSPNNNAFFNDPTGCTSFSEIETFEDGVKEIARSAFMSDILEHARLKNEYKYKEGDE